MRVSHHLTSRFGAQDLKDGIYHLLCSTLCSNYTFCDLRSNKLGSTNQHSLIENANFEVNISLGLWVQSGSGEFSGLTSL